MGLWAAWAGVARPRCPHASLRRRAWALRAWALWRRGSVGVWRASARWCCAWCAANRASCSRANAACRGIGWSAGATGRRRRSTPRSRPAGRTARLHRRRRRHARHGHSEGKTPCPVRATLRARAKVRCATATGAATRMPPRGAARRPARAPASASRRWRTDGAACMAATAPARATRPGAPRWPPRARRTASMAPSPAPSSP